MTPEEKRKIAEFEKDIKKMQKEHEKIFAEFNPPKKSLPQRMLDRLKSFFTRSQR